MKITKGQLRRIIKEITDGPDKKHEDDKVIEKLMNHFKGQSYDTINGVLKDIRKSQSRSSGVPDLRGVPEAAPSTAESRAKMKANKLRVLRRTFEYYAKEDALEGLLMNIKFKHGQPNRKAGPRVKAAKTEGYQGTKQAKITKKEIREIIREELIREMVGQDLSKPIPIDDLIFVDEEGYGAMMFPGPGYSYSVREVNFEAEKAKLKQRYGDDVMISTPDPRYPKVKKIHSTKFDRAQSRENQNFMRHQRMMGRRMGREPGLGS